MQVARENEKVARNAAAREAKAAAAASGSADADGAAEEEEEAPEGIEAFAELEALLAEPSVAALPEAVRGQLGALDTLVSSPHDDDEVVFALPVCAPYSALASYKYKVKLTPGGQKKGKAAKQAHGIFVGSASGRERDLLRALTEPEIIQCMLGGVKLNVAGKVLQAAKKDKKAAASKAAKAGAGDA